MQTLAASARAALLALLLPLAVGGCPEHPPKPSKSAPSAPSPNTLAPTTAASIDPAGVASPCQVVAARGALALARGALGRASAAAGEALCPETALVGGLAAVLAGQQEAGLKRLSAIDGGASPELRALGSTLSALALATGPAPGPSSALQALQASLSLDPDQPRARLLRALLLAPRDPAGARAEIAHLAGPPAPRLADPQDMMLRELPVWLLRILPAPARGRPPEAVSDGDRELQAARAELLAEVARRRWGRAYRDATQAARQALAAANRPLAKAPPQRVLVEVDLAWQLQDFPGVVSLCREFAAAHPGAPPNPGVETMLLRALNRLGAHQEMVARWGQRNPGDCLDCAALVAEAHVKLGDGQGLALLERLAALDPRRVDVLTLRGQTLLHAGRVPDALRSLRQAAVRAPLDLAVTRTLGQALRQAGADDEAQRVLERYGRILRNHQEGARAEELRSNVHASYSEAGDALRAGNQERAELVAASLRARQADFPLLPLLLAALQRARGETPSAELLDQVLAAARSANPWLAPRPSGMTP